MPSSSSWSTAVSAPQVYSIVEFAEAATGKKETRDFVIGWCLYVPQISTLAGKQLREGEVQLDLILGPGVSIFGDVLWDQFVARKDKKL